MIQSRSAGVREPAFGLGRHCVVSASRRAKRPGWARWGKWPVPAQTSVFSRGSASLSCRLMPGASSAPAIAVALTLACLGLRLAAYLVLIR